MEHFEHYPTLEQQSSQVPCGLAFRLCSHRKHSCTQFHPFRKRCKSDPSTVHEYVATTVYVCCYWICYLPLEDRSQCDPLLGFLEWLHDLPESDHRGPPNRLPRRLESQTFQGLSPLQAARDLLVQGRGTSNGCVHSWHGAAALKYGVSDRSTNWWYLSGPRQCHIFVLD